MALDDKGKMSMEFEGNDAELFCNLDKHCKRYDVCKSIECSCLPHKNPMSDTYNFDNILFSMLNIF